MKSEIAEMIADVPIVEKVEYKCYNCGKNFRDHIDLARHKKRKTPCLIREVAPENVLNPLRCIYCNKIFTKKENVTRHLGTCKIKNGGMDMLVDKVRYEQEIRILKEQRTIDAHIAQQKFQQMEDEMKQMKQFMTNMMQNPQIVQPNPQPQVVNNNTVNNAPVTVNNAPVQINNIVINNYNNPSIEGLTITAEDLITSPKMSKFLLTKMFFNPDAPENHCMYLKNKKDKSMIIHDNGNWRSVAGENVADVVLQLKNTIDFKGSELLNGKLGPYAGDDDLFTTLPGADQYKIIQFNTHKDQLTQDDLNEILLDGRDTVIGTIRASGCKLV